MPRVFIDRLDDPRIEVYRQLKRSNLTRAGTQFVVEGEKLFDRLREGRFPIASVLTTEQFEPRVAPRVPHGVPLYVVPDALLSVTVGFNFHRGVLAAGYRRPWPAPLDHVRPDGERTTVVVCPTLNNPENLGAIVRISDVFGVDAILVGPRCPDPLSRRVLRVSMGTCLRLPVLVLDDLAAVVERLRDELGFELVATDLDPAAARFDAVERGDRLALFLGSEGTGLDAEWLRRATRRVTIPMRPGAESLNVAVAAGILLYHFARV